MQQFVFPAQVRFLSSLASPSDITLCPYVQMNGRWTLPDETVLSVAEQSITDGTFKTVFMEGDVQSSEEFLMMMKSPKNIPVFAFRGLDVIAAGWLNNVSLNRAFCHFMFLSSAWGKFTNEAGRMIIDYWMSLPKDDDGGPLFDVLLGAVPASNQRAVDFAQKMGGTYLGRIPKMIVNAFTGDRIDAEILYYLRA